jgi:hypothetical protein
MVRSPDAAVPPAIQLNTVTAPADLDALVRAIRLTAKSLRLNRWRRRRHRKSSPART